MAGKPVQMTVRRPKLLNCTGKPDHMAGKRVRVDYCAGGLLAVAGRQHAQLEPLPRRWVVP